MSHSAKLKLFVGIVLLAIGCFALFLYFNYTQSVVRAESAQLQTKNYDIGTPYSGRITKQFVQESDEVTAGQKLFYLQSSKLTAQLQQPHFQKSDLPYPLTKNHQLIIKSSKAGVIKTIKNKQGSFVPNGTVLAVVAQTKNLKVTANVMLSPGQNANLTKASRLIVTLPSGDTEATPISDVTITQHGNRIIAKMTGKLANVKYNPLTTKDGTPVKTKLRIKQPLWSQLYNHVRGYL
jgi:multidrug efflux pump subunit AcrA (membrane-fusion protein)